MSVPVPRPTVADVARKLRVRSRDELGNALATFTADTTPTAGEVDAYIDDAAGFVSARVGALVRDELAALAASVVALRAAILVAVGDPELNGQTDLKDLRAVYTEELGALLEAGRDTSRPRYGTIAVRTPLSPATPPQA
jgi:hypothetical protein